MKQAFLFLLLTVPVLARAQHEHHTDKSMPGMNTPGMKMNSAGDSTMSGMRMMNHGLTMDTTMGMTHSLSRNLPMNRNGSGTSWHPDNTPMYAYMSQSSGSPWSYMLHYAIYLRYTSQNSNNPDRRGNGRQFGAPNWFMGMAQRKVGQRGLFQVRAMLSFDALTVGNGGYPLLFQTGESYRGQPLIDRQHPHDIVSELSVSYSHAFSKDIDLYGYLGYPGEPTVGPPVFMHRISSFGMPDAPISHHWQDATHITFGVATAGLRYKWAKLEVSTFKGREPDENRFDFDKPRFDSYSYRLSVNPSPSLAFQFSQGYIKSPEDLHPDENVFRTTASVLHSKGLGPDSYVTSAFVYGLNAYPDHAHPAGRPENSFLAESSLQWKKFNVFGRYENVGKSAEELVLLDPRSSLADNPFRTNPVLTINSLTAGMNYRIAQYRNTDLALGALTTLSMPDRLLQGLYGKMPISGEIYLRLSPSLMTMQSMMKGMGARRMHRM